MVAELLRNLLLNTGWSVEKWIHKKEEAPLPVITITPDFGTDEAHPFAEVGNQAGRQFIIMPYRIRRPERLDVSLEVTIKTEPDALT